MIEFTMQDLMFIYERMKVEEVQICMLREVRPNPIHDDSYRDQLSILTSITNKLEKSYPKFLDETPQRVIREKAENKLLNKG